MQAIVKKQFVQVDAQEHTAAVRGSAAPRSCKKSVRLLRIEGAVQALEVTCSCGELTVVELEYQASKEEA
jgi:hypothetical protein